MKVSSDMEDKLERVLHLLDDLASESARGIPILVEGRRDAEALKALEIRGEVIAVKTKSKNLLDQLSEVEERGKGEVVLLMDFDRRGKELMKYLTLCLEKMKIRPNTVFWRELSSLLRRDLKDIEGLPTYIRTLKGKAGKI